MAHIEDHVRQATRNLKFLENINQLVSDSLDWQVTTCFYTALHLINAHLANFGMQYKTHYDVDDAINPQHQLSVSKINEEAYKAYKMLYNLSRRSRYLVMVSNNRVVQTGKAELTYCKHQARALRHLNTVLEFYCNHYKTSISTVNISCEELSASEGLKYFTLIKR